MKNILGLLLAVTFTLGLAPSLRAADTADYGLHWGSIIVPDGLSKDQVKKEILMAAVNRGWTIVDKSSNDKIAIHHEAGSWVSNVVFTYDKKEVQIYHHSTKKGKPQVPSWLDNLKKDIVKNLNMLSISE